MPPPFPAPPPPPDDYRTLFYCGTLLAFPIIRSYSDSLTCHTTNKKERANNYYSRFRYSDLEDGMIFAARPDVVNVMQTQVAYSFRFVDDQVVGGLSSLVNRMAAGLRIVKTRHTTEDEKLLYILDSVDRP